MATLILTAAGTAIGGPLGGAVGALIGQRVDRSVLGVRREGPRIAELAVQTSSYGTEIPRLFGTMRVAGTVIWATDLIETRGSSGGKGQARTTTYSYSANFAVALSSRPLTAVGRVWADGRLVRGTAGDWKVRTGFRLHRGGEDQAPDPLIASVEGAGLAPAHRGIAYAVFEGLELAGFGNRIPALTFEVTADAGTVASGTVMRTLAADVAVADAGLALDGFAAGGSVRGVLAGLAQASGGWFARTDGKLAFANGNVPTLTVADAGFGGARGVRSVAAAGSVPGVVAVSHYDAARDYQAGLQRARRSGAVAGREEAVEVAAVLSPDAAKAVAQAMLARGEAERERRTVAAGLDALDLPPGTIVAVEGAAGAWRVTRTTLEAMAVTLELVRLSADVGILSAASGGRVLAQADAPAGRTRLHAFELPALDGAVLAMPRLLVAATGEGEGWRGARLLVSIDDGETWQEAGETTGAATLGTVIQPPAAGPATLADRAGVLDVALLRADMTLEPADDAQLDRGANLALAGDELVQFGRAEPLGEGRWRLSRLLRGRRGTEWAAGTQAAGDRFVLIAADAVKAVDLPAGTRAVRLLANGVGDAEPARATALLDGASVRPPGVVRLDWVPAGPGEATVRWVRRSRVGWRWTDGADAPLAEERELYLVTVTRADGTVTHEERPEHWVTVPRATTVTVRQRGTMGDSRPATIAVPA